MSRLDSHVSAVQRKLMVAAFVEWLARALLVALVAALVTIVLQRMLQFGVPRVAIWSAVGITALVAIVGAVLKRPSRESAAVAIDERLALKEKFSTALSVRQHADPFAKAVVLDAEQTAQNVLLAGHFPLEFPSSGYWAIGTAVLTLLAFMFIPAMDLLGREQKARQHQEEQKQIAQGQQVVREALAKIEAMPRSVADAEKVRIAKAELAEMLKHPMPDRETSQRRAMEALDKADAALKQQAQENKNFSQAQANQKMFKSMNPPIEAKGPVADAQRELVKGDYEEAIEKLKEAVNKFDQMSQKDKDEAAKQMQQMAQQLAQMAQDPRAMEKMAEQMKQMGANQQQIQQAQQMIQQAAQGDEKAQQQLQQMQQQLAQAMQQQGMSQQQIQQMQQMMQQAQQAANAQAQAQQMSQAAQQMAQAMQQASQGGAQGQQGQQQMAQGQQQMQQQLQQMQAMQQDAEQIAAAQKAMQDAMAQAGGQGRGGNGQGDNPNGPGNTGEWKAGDPENNRGQGQGGPGIGAGGQGQKAARAFSVKQEISKSYYDEKGKHLASIYVKDKSLKGEAKLELQKVIDAGKAEEGDDVDDSQSDRRTQEVQRRYFKVMEDAVNK